MFRVGSRSATSVLRRTYPLVHAYPSSSARVGHGVSVSRCSRLHSRGCAQFAVRTLVSEVKTELDVGRGGASLAADTTDATSEISMGSMNC